MAFDVWSSALLGLVVFKKGRSLARRAVAKLTDRRPDGFATALPRPIPRRIWILWNQGEAEAPPLVQLCIQSWRDRNPGWEVTVLDADSLTTVVEMSRPQGGMTIQAYSDLVRLRLLRRFGGVWVDATVACLKPLDDWLPPVARHGFFAFLWTASDSWFVRPNVHRIMTTWFLATEAEGALVSAWEDRAVRYWQHRERPHDYYWVHLLFEQMALFRPSVRRAVAAMPRLGAYTAHLVHDYVHKGPVAGREAELIRAALATGAAPVQKLRWNWTPAQVAAAAEVLPMLAAAADAGSAAPAAAVSHG